VQAFDRQTDGRTDSNVRSNEARCAQKANKILSLTYKVLITTQPSYLYDLISLQPHPNIRSSDVVTLACPTLYSSLKVNNRFFRYASPRPWYKPPKELRQPVDDESLSLTCCNAHWRYDKHVTYLTVNS